MWHHLLCRSLMVINLFLWYCHAGYVQRLWTVPSSPTVTHHLLAKCLRYRRTMYPSLTHLLYPTTMLHHTPPQWQDTYRPPPPPPPSTPPPWRPVAGGEAGSPVLPKTPSRRWPTGTWTLWRPRIWTTSATFQDQVSPGPKPLEADLQLGWQDLQCRR